MPVEALDVADLGTLGDRLGGGGQAEVYDAPELRIPGAPDRLVYKRYRPGGATRRPDMERLIELRDQLSAGDRARLDTVTTWPVRVVIDGGGMRGVVLPRIDDSFFQPVTLPSGSHKLLVREVQHLFVDPDRCRRLGMPTATVEQRLWICHDFAAALDFLHTPPIDVTFGDINAKNELFRLSAEPTIMFVDCDAVRRRGYPTGQPMLDAPDWEPPSTTSHRAPLNQETDRYKLGLFVLRCLAAPGDQASTRRNAADAKGVLDPDGYGLLAAALHGAPAQRPTAHEWLRYLSVVLGQPLEPPTLRTITIDRTLVPAGETVTVYWVATGAQTVEVSARGVDTVICDGRPGAGTVEICPARTGVLTVVARNLNGDDTRRTVPVAVYDVPDFARLPVPMPTPAFDDTQLPDLPDAGPVLPLRPAPVLARGPVVETGPPPVAMPVIELYDEGPVDPARIMLGGSPLSGEKAWKKRRRKRRAE